jgi:hypothetical protein
LTKGVYGNLVIVVTSERGRSPRLDADGCKHAWPFTSTLLWGAGLAGGRVAGLTDDYGRGRKVNPLFGEPTGRTDDVYLDMAHLISALYLKNGVAYRLLVPDHKPLAVILQT